MADAPVISAVSGGEGAPNGDGDKAARLVPRQASKIPLLTVNAGPRDENWVDRLKEEYAALIQYVKVNKENDSDWFAIKSNKTGTKWFGTCWYVHELVRYEFDLTFDIPVTYPTTNPDLVLEELEGKTAKMYRGGRICLTEHFHPLWAKNVPTFGIAHALALGLAPWLAAEVPDLLRKGLIEPKQRARASSSSSDSGAGDESSSSSSSSGSGSGDDN